MTELSWNPHQDLLKGWNRNCSQDTSESRSNTIIRSCTLVFAKCFPANRCWSRFLHSTLWDISLWVHTLLGYNLWVVTKEKQEQGREGSIWLEIVSGSQASSLWFLETQVCRASIIWGNWYRPNEQRGPRNYTAKGLHNVPRCKRHMTGFLKVEFVK